MSIQPRPAEEHQTCAFGALILCDGHVQLTGPSRGRHCPCALEELADGGADELVRLPAGLD